MAVSPDYITQGYSRKLSSFVQGESVEGLDTEPAVQIAEQGARRR